MVSTHEETAVNHSGHDRQHIAHNIFNEFCRTKIFLLSANSSENCSGGPINKSHHKLM